MLKKCLLLLLMVLAGSSLWVQLTVTGTVTDSNYDPVPGVSVVIKGTSVGTISDIDGNYALQAAASDVLVFSFVGMDTQEVAVEGRSTINVTMQSSFLDLEEVVVVGYGVQKKKLNTGATIQVKGDDIQRMNTTSPLQALQGQTPGVSISSTSLGGAL